MSFRVFFSLSTGLKEPITVPKGTLKKILERVALTEKSLGLETEQYRDNPKHWRNTEPKEGVSDKTLCDVAEDHNQFVIWLYHKFEECSQTPTPDGEVITVEDAANFWHGLDLIDVPAHKWDRDYYQARMTALYEAMRGRESEGMIFDSDPLTPEQAGDVINLFAQYLDSDDIRLDVPLGYDLLTADNDGEYTWCEKCGGLVSWGHVYNCEESECPLKDLIDD